MPHILSLLRLAGAPVLLAVAWAGRTTAFWIVLAVMLTSDALDGWAARRLGVVSELGRRLDSLGDYTTMLALPLGTWWLWPSVVRAEAWWLAVLVAAFFGPIVYALVRWRIVPGYHTWGAKAAAVVLSIAYVLRFAWGIAWPLHLGVVLQVLVALEEFAIMVVRPGWSGPMPSVWHARRRGID